ncbi:diguanylate cyclase domain-containing protein [Nakamurella endophytica]|nr:diguanylate cyclase [Nakamurella endophytica]
MTCFACGDVLTGCPEVFLGADDAEILELVVAHAAQDHGITDPPPGFADQVLAATAPVSDYVAGVLLSGGDRHVHVLPGRRDAARTVRAPGYDVGLLRSVFDDAPVAVAVTAVDGHFLHVNQALCDLLGMPAATLAGLALDDVLAPAQVAQARQAREQMLAERQHRHQGEFDVVRSDGRTVPVELTCALVLRSDGEPEHVVCHLQDITARRADHRRLAEAAQYDPLTGLPNRAYFFEQLEQALFRRDLSSGTVVVLFCDLDRFKAINDTYGHQVGDEVLVEFAARLLATTRRGDLAARLAGDEFVVLFEHGSRLNPDRLIRRIQREMAAPFAVAGLELPVRVSIGAAVADRPGSTASELLRLADEAMYTAKPRDRG